VAHCDQAVNVPETEETVDDDQDGRAGYAQMIT
jgi:hypothetical protein